VITRPLQAIFAAPFLRRIGFHARRIGGEMDRHFFTSLITAVVGFVAVAAVVITFIETDKQSFAGLRQLSAKIGGEHRATLLAVRARATR